MNWTSFVARFWPLCPLCNPFLKTMLYIITLYICIITDSLRVLNPLWKTFSSCITFWVIMGITMNKHKRNTQDFKQRVDYQESTLSCTNFTTFHNGLDLRLWLLPRWDHFPKKVIRFRVHGDCKNQWYEDVVEKT